MQLRRGEEGGGERGRRTCGNSGLALASTLVLPPHVGPVKVANNHTVPRLGQTEAVGRIAPDKIHERLARPPTPSAAPPTRHCTRRCPPLAAGRMRTAMPSGLLVRLSCRSGGYRRPCRRHYFRRLTSKLCRLRFLHSASSRQCGGCDHTIQFLLTSPS